MFVKAVLGRYRYHQSRRCLPSTSRTMSIELIQRVASLTVDGALCPGLARVRDAREQRKTCCLSVALTEGAAAAFQPSHLLSSQINHLLSALTFPITITSLAILVAIPAVVVDTHNVNTKPDLLLRTITYIIFTSGGPSSRSASTAASKCHWLR